MILYHMGDKAILKNYSQVLSLLVRLRQVCAHPYLVKDELERKEKESSLNASRNGMSDALDSYSSYGRNGSSNNNGTSCDGFDLAHLDDDIGGGECWKCGSIPEVACLTKCQHLYCEECFELELDQSRNNKSFECGICGTVIYYLECEIQSI